jgi:hypothetical protein
MKKSQTGSAHVIIIIILVAGLVGALGALFWKNNMNKSEPTTKSVKTMNVTEQSKDSVASTMLEMKSVFKNGLSLSYPNGWTAQHVGVTGDNPPKDDGVTVDAYVLTSPDKTVDLSVIQSSGGQRGGTCLPEEEPHIDTYSYQQSRGWNSAAYADYVVKRSGSYDTGQILALNMNAETIKAGDSSCRVAYLELVKTDKIVQSSAYIELITAISQHGTDKKMTFPSLKDAAKYLASQTGKDIKDILLSIK